MLNIGDLFNALSPQYDRTNRILSFGLDPHWRKKLSPHLPPKPHLELLDLATGTADQLIAFFETGASIHRAVGLDLASEMLAVGNKKLAFKSYKGRIELKTGDALHVPFATESFDAVSCSFGIRNMSDTSAALSEMHRVLRPKGRCLILEFSLPKKPVLWGYLLYLRYLLPTIGGWLSKNKQAYTYLNQTIEKFPSGSAFCAKMKEAGFQRVKAHTMALGAVTLYVGEKDLLA